MKRLLYLLALLLLTAAHSCAQQTPITATVVDPRGFPWQAATGMSSIQCAGNGQPYYNRSPLTRTIPITGLDGNGKFNQILWDTAVITDVNGAPLSCQWRVSLTDACNVATFSVLVTGVTGSTLVNLSSQINAAAVNLSPACTPPATVQSVTVGNLPPLFTASVSSPTVNPNVTFALISQSPNLVFASPSSGSGVPSFRALVSGDLPGGTGTVTNVTGTPPITSTGGATPAIGCPTCVTSVSGTANQITSSGGTTPTLSIPATFIAPGSIQATTSVTAANVTDSALTSGRCVQAGASGLLTNVAGACANGSGFTQIATASAVGCTTQGTSFSNCDVTLTWSNGGFADTGYIPACSLKDTNLQASGGDGSSGDVPNAPIRSFNNTQITVALTTLAARAISGAANVTITCVGVHP
jgi:hypothetical protein